MFRIIGGVIGFFMGSIFGVFGMIFGAILGSNAGRSVDSLLFGNRRNNNQQSAEEAYRKFYEQFYQNARQSYNTGYGSNSDFGYNGYQAGASDKCYSDLGCSRSDSNDDIKRRYRKLVAQYHPDRMAGKGLSESEMRAAEAKFKDIQESYSQIKKEKGI